MVQSGTGPQGPRRQRKPDDGDRADAAASSDEAVIALLAGLAPLTAPDNAERARMRERVLAGMNRPSPVPSPVPRPASARPPRAGRAPRGRRTGRRAGRPGEEPRASGFGARGRFAVAAVAVLALVFSLAGMSLLLARDALPGDTLYGIKRTGEAASLGLTFGDEDRAFKHLEFATARVGELETLDSRYANPADAPLGAYLSALTDFDHDAAAGSRSLTAVATTTGDDALLATLRDWSEQQHLRLGALRPPAAALPSQAVSLALLDRIAERAAVLADRLPCDQVTAGGLDDVGPLPATSGCTSSPEVTAPLSSVSAAPTTARPGQGPGTAPGPVPGGPTPPGGPEPTAPSTLPPLLPTTTVVVTTTALVPNVPPPLPLPTIEAQPLLPILGQP